MSGNLLEVRGLTKSFGTFRLEPADLTVPIGCIVGLVGSNGAGKTTMIKCVLGTLFPDGGSILLLGREVARSNPGYVGSKAFAQLRQGVAFVPDICVFPTECFISALERLHCQMYPTWDSREFLRLCKLFSLEEDKRVSDLSRGMGMKLSLACALAAKPQLLVLDEATAGLDPLAREEVLQVLRDFVAQGDRSVLMSSHITSDLEKAADRVVCIDCGRIIFDKDADEVLDLPGVAHCRAVELEELLNARAYEPGELRLRRGAYGTDVLVPDRFAFAEAFPGIAVDRASLDEYLALTLKGEQR